MKSLKIALLSTHNSPLLGYTLQSFLAQGLPIHSVILDSRVLGEKDLQIWEERTQGSLPVISPGHFESRHIPFYFVENHSSTITAQFVREQGIDLLVNAGTPRILKQEILKAPTVGVLNCHPGLLPNFRGCTCVEWAIYLDEQVGNTAHLMTEKIDEGPIILQEGLHFLKSDRYADVRIKVYRHAFDLLARAAAKIMESEQDYATLAFPRDGRYFEVIDAEKMQQVVAKIAAGRYAYQQ